MKIIGHRGAAGLALENTIEAIRAGIDAGVDAIELDIRLTHDRQLVLSHDPDIGRVSKKSYSVVDYLSARLPFLKKFPRIQEHSLAKLKTIRLRGGQEIASLEEAIQAAGHTPLVIEGKDNGWATPLTDFLKKRKNLPEFSVISFNHEELGRFHALMPGVPTYALESTSPFDAIRTARLAGFSGVNLNFWILNPLTYWLARFHHLEIIVFTVNKTWMASFLRALYPGISITTNLPNKMQFLRPKTLRKLQKHGPRT